MHRFNHGEYPFGLLTMIVSLEAIFLSTFVLVSQNRLAARANIRSQVDFESNLQSLNWLVHLAHKSNVDVAHVDKLCAEACKYRLMAIRRGYLSGQQHQRTLARYFES